MYAGFDSITKPEAKIYYKTIDSKKMSEVKLTEMANDFKSLYYYFHEVNCTDIVIKIKRKGTDQKMKIAELQLTRPPVNTGFNFCHYTTDVFESTGKKVKISFESKRIKDFAIFYKSADTKVLIDKEKWNTLDIRTVNPASIHTDGKKFHRFLMVYEPEPTATEIKNVIIKNVD